MGIEGVFFIIGMLIALTIAYFLIGLILSYFVGTTKIFFYSFIILIILAILIFAIFLSGAQGDPATPIELLAVMAIFIAFPTASLFVGMLINDLIRNISKK